MKRRSLSFIALCLFLCGSYCPWGGVHAQKSVLPEIVRAGASDRHIEALGREAGIWGTLELGLEAWVYPFKAFDSVEIGVLNREGVFRSLTEHIARQRATPVRAILEFRQEGLDLQAEFFVPRFFPGGNLRFEGRLPDGHSLALKLRSVLTPMHLKVQPGLAMAWLVDQQAVEFENRSLGARLFLSAASLLQAERTSGESVLLNLGSSLEHGVDLSFSVHTDLGVDRDSALELLSDLRDRSFPAAVDYYRDLIARMPRVHTPDPEVNDALLWSGLSLDQLRIRNPDLGWGLVSGFSSSKGGTRPKYAWFFEEPTLSSWAYHRLGLSDHVKESLEFLSEFHREDGKSVHEVSQSLRYWPDYFESFKFAYMHTDGPVYYLIAYGHYLRSTGDLEFIRAHWDIIQQIYAWCRGQVDESDGLIRVDRGDWGSAESSTDILKDTQLEAMWVRALREFAYLSRAMGEESSALETHSRADRAQRSIEDGFWDEEQGFYIWGMNRAGQKIHSLVPHHAIGFWLGEFRSDRVSRALRTLASSEFMTDWGVRSLALGDPKFDEASYQSGSVWPVWNAGVIISDYRNGYSLRGFQNWRGTIESRWRLGAGPMPEVLRGDRFELLPDAVPHQMFSEVAVVNGFFGGMMGLEVDVPGRRIVIAPRLPAEWDEVWVERIPFGTESFDVKVEKKRKLYAIEIKGQFDEAVQFCFRPELSADSLVEEVRDSQRRPYFLVRRSPRAKTLELERKLERGPYRLEIQHEANREVRVWTEPLLRGQSSQRLRILDYGDKGSWWQAELEGLAGRAYFLEFDGSPRPGEIEGGRVVREEPERFVVETSGAFGLQPNRAGYVRWKLKVKGKDRSDRWRLLDRDLEEGWDTEYAKAAWTRKVARIRRAMMSVMGRLPGEERLTPLEVRVLEEEDCGSYLRRLVEYQSEPGSWTPAYLLIPKDCLNGARKTIGVLCLHPTDHQIGHKVVVGLGGRPGRNYAEELAERGFVTIAPSYPLLANYQPDLGRLGYQSGTMKAIWDNIRAIDLLESLPFVRRGGFGAVGHSLGGHNAIYTAIFEPRIKAIATSCAFDSYLDFKDGDIRGWTSERYMPRLLEYGLEEIPFDFSELLGALAPRSLFVSAPKGDTNFDWESVSRVVAAARPVYELYNARDSLQVRHPDCEHDFPVEMREEAYAFLLRALGEEADQ